MEQSSLVLKAISVKTPKFSDRPSSIYLSLLSNSSTQATIISHWRDNDLRK